MLTGNLKLLSLTSIISCSLDSHLGSEGESSVLSELSISALSGVSSILVGLCLGVLVSGVISFASYLW